MFIRLAVREIHDFCIFCEKWLFQLKIAIFKTKSGLTHQVNLCIISNLIMGKAYRPWFTFKSEKMDKNSQKQPFLGIFAFTHIQNPPWGMQVFWIFGPKMVLYVLEQIKFDEKNCPFSISRLWCFSATPQHQILFLSTVDVKSVFPLMRPN